MPAARAAPTPIRRHPDRGRRPSQPNGNITNVSFDNLAEYYPSGATFSQQPPWTISGTYNFFVYDYSLAGGIDDVRVSTAPHSTYSAASPAVAMNESYAEPIAPYGFAPVSRDVFSDGTINVSGVRTIEPGTTQWSSPDAADPASASDYVWENNNPYMFRDPSGYIPGGSGGTNNPNGMGGLGNGSIGGSPPDVSDIVPLRIDTERGNQLPRTAPGMPTWEERDAEAVMEQLEAQNAGFKTVEEWKAAVEARALRDALAARVGRKVATVTGGYNIRTGQVAAAGCSKGPVCAEVNVFNTLGGVKDEVRFTKAIRPRTGEEVPICPACQAMFGRDPFPRHPVQANSMKEKALDDQLYPAGIDCSWLASDGSGCVGSFITAGAGPIPRFAFTEGIVPIEDIEDLLLELPVCSEYRLLSTPPNVSSYVALAQRGLYVYDWTDFHRTSAEIRAYELVALPITPRSIEALVGDLRYTAQTVRFPHVAFSESKTLDVRKHFDTLDA